MLVEGCSCVMPWFHLETSVLAIMPLTFNILSLLYHKNHKVSKVILGRDVGLGCKCATLWCDLDFTLDLFVVTLTFKISLGVNLGNCRV